MKAPRPGRPSDSSRVPPPDFSMRDHPWWEGHEPIHSAMRSHRPWPTKKNFANAIFDGNEPFEFLKYRKHIKQGRYPAEFGRTSRPGLNSAKPRILFPHTHLSSLFKKEPSPFSPRRRETK